MDTPRKLEQFAIDGVTGTPGHLAENPFRALDHAKEAWIARATGGLSPAALALAFADWFIHLLAAPGKQWQLAALTVDQARQLFEYGCGAVRREPAPPSDDRFRASAWQTPPFCFWKQAFLLTEQWWSAATHETPGTTHHHEAVVSFAARQWLDVFSPGNFPPTNPEVIQRTAATFGANLVLGTWNALDDAWRVANGQPPAGTQRFKPGVDVAVTPGNVVFRNHLIELIQYRPSTARVAAEPILIVPAWIMKYYILDLSPHNSLVRYLVGQGYTVFCISWRNVGQEDRDLGLDDYLSLGVMAALDAISRIVPSRKIHAAGYCLGGTLLAIAAAEMAGRQEERLASITLFAAQTDFSEPGELQLFIDESQVYFLESLMWERGYLGGDEMAGSFQLLQSNDLIWSRAVHDYLLGERAPMSDLIAWNADRTRMPYRMHSEYLRKLFLHNDLASTRYEANGRPVSLRNIRAPMFVVGTERDHIAPWRSVYKIHYLSDTDVTFVLTSGGHNAGIVSEPGHPHRHYRVKSTAIGDISVGPDEWLACAEVREGSWWTAWSEWLTAHCSAEHVAPPHIGLPDAGGHVIADAPGTYVFQK
ncbi:PHA/PHB synthase family protein [Trinickia dinghuensis]|uniref:Alpha/beta fold hydrolase n=1 Tax=Trinickia dinghuensis TaxID=2291023 RepID=A0A3D8K1K6_9BURK|nr:alpha/beta fold hydrolase [Trinickia dinghuensis]RDU99337.1 alpha/beta fold hydrolase [Trinickia dinghuensis]